MRTGEKIARMRRENNYTQEQLAERMGVSRQSISKWESGLAYPETEKLIALSTLFHCSLDYLLRDEIEEESIGQEKSESFDSGWGKYSFPHIERKSEKTIFGMPLWHIGKKARGFIAVGLNAKGVISIGLFSRGIISIGLVSIGFLAIGMLALGILAAGSISAGILATGAIAVGIVACGAIAIGQFSVGALALAHYIAVGDYAVGMFAFGESHADGKLFETVKELSSEEKKLVLQMIKEQIPNYYGWFRSWFENWIQGQ